MLDEDNFKSTYQILLEISKVWNTLNDKDRASLLEKMAGKHRASVVAAILNDQITLMSAYADACDAAGSAQEEYQKRTASIEYHLNQLTAAWQQLATNTATTEFINTIIDGAKSLVEFANSVGLVNIGLGALGTTLGVLYTYKISPWLDAQVEAMIANEIALNQVNGIALDSTNNLETATRQISSNTRTATTGITRLSAATKIFGTVAKGVIRSIGIAFAISALFTLIEKTSNFIDKYENKDKYAKEDVQNSQDKLKELIDEYKALTEKEDITAEESNRIDLLKEEISLQQQSLDIDKQRYAQTIVDKYSKKAQGSSDDDEISDFHTAESEKTYVSNAQKAIQTTSKLSRSYLENKARVQELTEENNKLQKSLAEQVVGSEEYIEIQSRIKNISDEVNSIESKNNNIYSEAIERLKELNDQRAEQAYAVENSIGKTKEEAQALLDDTDRAIEYTKTIHGMEGANSELAASQSDAIKKYSELRVVQEKFANGVGLTKEELDDLAQKYPELSSLVQKYGTITDEAYQLSEDGIRELGSTSQDIANAIIDNEIVKTQNVIANVKARIEAYEKEAEAAKLVADEAEKESSEYFKSAKEKLFDLDFGGAIHDARSAIKYSFKGLAYETIELNKYRKADKLRNEISDKEKEIQNLLKQLDSISVTKTGETTNGNKGKEPGNPDFSSDSKEAKKIERWDNYGAAIDRVTEKLEAYDNAIDVTQKKLDENQAYEERSTELMKEEGSLYDKLRAQLEAKRKATNDALWEQNQNLDSMYKRLSALTGMNVDSSTLIADLNAWYDKKAIANEKWSDSVNAQEAQQLINAIEELRSVTHDWQTDIDETDKNLIELNNEEITIKFNYQDDILEKFNQQRTISQKTLDILDNINGAEEHRTKLTDYLIDSYKQENSQLEAMYKQNLVLLNEVKQKYEENSNAYKDYAKQISEQNTKIHEQQLSNLQSEYNLRKKQLDIQNELNEKAAEYEYYGSAGKEAWEDARQEEIDRLQKELDALDKDNSEEQYLKNLAEKEKQIAELEEKLNNLRNQKTIQQLKQMDDGSYQWEYIVDQRAINETLADLEEARNDLKETQDEHALELQKENIQNKIDAIQNEVDEREKQYRRELQLIEDTYESSIDSLDRWLADEVENCNKRIANMEKFNKEYDKTLNKGLESAKTTVDAGLSGLYASWDSSMRSIYETVDFYASLAETRIRDMYDSLNAAMSESEMSGDIPGFAKGLKFVESNGMLARLHYGERVLTRSEAVQYNSLEDDIKSGKLESYFDSLKENAKLSVSNVISTNASSFRSVPETTSNTNQFVIENITLPNVSEPTNFASELESWAAREFGGLAQKAKIKRAK